MPCSCGMTFCPCGIPCYCLAESCKCKDCAIALPHFCKLCNKPLISHMKTEDVCSCFLGESLALILENRDIPMWRMGNIPMSNNNFVTGKLTVNFTIPIPTLRSPHLIPQQSFCFMPPSSVEETKTQNPSDSYANALKQPSPKRAKLCEFPIKHNSHFSDYDSSGYSSNSEQTTEIPGAENHNLSEILQSTSESQTVHIKQEMGTEICANTGEKTSFYLPSVIIDNISRPVRLEDPVWRLPNPEIVVGPETTLNIINPFYLNGPIDAIQNNEYNPGSTLGVNEVYCSTESEVGNVLKESGMPLQINKHVLNPTIIPENLVMQEENRKITYPSSNTAASSNNSAVPYSSNAIGHQFVTSSFWPLKANSKNHITERISQDLIIDELRQSMKWMSSQENSQVAFPIQWNPMGQEATVEQTSRLKNPLYIYPQTIEKMEKYLNLKNGS